MIKISIASQEFASDNSVTIELAKPSDAEAVSMLLRQTWIDTYPNAEAGISEDDVRMLIEGKNGEKIQKNIENWRNRIESSTGEVAVFVARKGGEIIGMTAPCKIEGQSRVGAIYVLPDNQGQGIGFKLMEQALSWHGNDEDIYLHVANYNQNAISFYESFGFTKTKKAIINDRDTRENVHIPEIEMVRAAL